MTQPGHGMLDAMLADPRPEVDLALAAALPSADAETRSRLTYALLRRGHALALGGLVRCFFHLSPEDQHRVVEAADTLYRPLREACREPAGRLPALAIIRRSGEPKLAYLVVDLLHDPDPAVADDAGACLVELARQAATDHRQGVKWSVSARGAAELVHQVERAAARPAGGPGVEAAVEAAMWLLPRPLPGLQATLHDVDHPATQAFHRRLERVEGDATPRAVLWALTVPTLRVSAVAALHAALESGQAEAILAHHAVLRLPAARQALKRAHRLVEGLGSGASRGDTPIHVAKGLLALIDAIPLDPAAAFAALDRLASHVDASVRLAALCRIAPLAAGSRDAAERLHAACDDPDERVARVAVTAWLDAQRDAGLRPLLALVGNPHAGVRDLAGRRLGPRGFEQLWRAWPRLEPARRLAAGEAMIRIHRGFHRVLGERLIAADTATRLQALSMIAELGQGGFFEKLLLRLADDEDARVAAAAVRALGSVDHADARRRRAAACEDPRPEVRAEAVAAVPEEDADQRRERLLAAAGDEGAEPRARAVRGLLALGDDRAAGLLSEMLRDERPEHRLAALRIAEKLRMVSLARDVAEMAVSDAAERVRGRAWRVMGSMIEELNAWQASAEDDDDPAHAGVETDVEPRRGEPGDAPPDPLAVLGSVLA